MKRFTACDHDKRGTCGCSDCRFFSQLLQRREGVVGLRPRLLGVTPAATNRAASQANEEGTAACMDPLTLKGVEGFNDRECRDCVSVEE